MNYGMRFLTLYRRQGSRPSPWKRIGKKQNGCLRRPYTPTVLCWLEQVTRSSPPESRSAGPTQDGMQTGESGHPRGQATSDQAWGRAQVTLQSHRAAASPLQTRPTQRKPQAVTESLVCKADEKAHPCHKLHFLPCPRQENRRKSQQGPVSSCLQPPPPHTCHK